MVRTKAPPQESAKLALRVRHAGGTCSISVATDSTVTDLLATLQLELGAPVASCSFRGATGAVVNLLLEESRALSDLGLAANDCLNVSIVAAAAAAVASPSKKKKQSKKRKVDSDDESDGYEGEEDEARSTLGPTLAKAALAGGATLNEDFATIAASFINAHEAADSMVGVATGMWVSQLGASRSRAAQAGLVTVTRTAKRLRVAWRASKNAKTEKEEEVRLLTAEDCFGVVLAVLDRQSGTRRRRLASDAVPSTRLLTADSIASRCPALFWSLYANSRCDDDGPGDVGFALDHVLRDALAKHKEQTLSMQQQQG